MRSSCVSLAAQEASAHRPVSCLPMLDTVGQWSCPIAGSPECEGCPIRRTMRRPPIFRRDPPQPAPKARRRA